MRFLDGYVSDEGEALITALTHANGTKETLRFLCWSAAQALEVARTQHDRAVRQAKAEAWSEER